MLDEEAIRRWAKRHTESSFNLTKGLDAMGQAPDYRSEEVRQQAIQASVAAMGVTHNEVPPMTPDEQFEMAVRLAQLEGFASRIINLSDRERRIISLGQIQDWAKMAMNGPDARTTVEKLAREIVARDGELLDRLKEND